jgi:hypothetical protein
MKAKSSCVILQKPEHFQRPQVQQLVSRSNDAHLIQDRMRTAAALHAPLGRLSSGWVLELQSCSTCTLRETLLWVGVGTTELLYMHP